MPPNTLAKVGAAILVVAVLLFWGTGYWLNTRTFEPVDMAISLDARDIQTGNFDINLREKFQVFIHLDPSYDDYWNDGRCNSDSLPEKSWKALRVSDQGSAEFEVGSAPRRPIEWYANERYLGQFQAVPGTYRFELQTSRAATCLNVRHPHLRISTPAQDYEAICNWLLYLWLFVGGSGAVLALSSTWSWKRQDLHGPKVARICPEMAVRNVVPLKRHRPMVAIHNLGMFGPTWFGVIAALSVVFLLFLTKPLMRYGLPIDFRQPHVMSGSIRPWRETLGVYVDAHRRFLVNGELIKPENLRKKLTEELGQRMVWTVYVEADRDSVFEDMVHAIDTIQGLGAKVVWITPKIRDEWSEHRPLRTHEGSR